MKIKNLKYVVTAVLAAVIISGCSTDDKERLSGIVKVAGSSTVYPVTVAMAEEFNKLHPGVNISVQSTGSGGGFKNFFIPGRTDINAASRPIKESERKDALAEGITPIKLDVAIDAVTVIVNPEADWVDNLTVDELAKIWRPDNPAKKWSDVRKGWPDKKIELYGPTSASGTFDYFTEVIIGESGASRPDYQKTEQDNTIVQAVSGSEYAIGYFGLSYYLSNKDRVKALAINGVKPAIQSAAAGDYTPLSRPLFIYVSDKSLEKEVVREFVKFYIKNSSGEIIKQIGYVPVGESVVRENLEKIESYIK